MELVTATATAMLLLTLVALVLLLLPAGAGCQAATATATAMVGYGMVGVGGTTAAVGAATGSVGTTGLGVVYRLGVLAGRALMLMPPSILVLGIGWMWMPLQVVNAGYHEKRLLHNLLDNYNVLERPVVNESDPLQLSFGLTLMQIIDVVSFVFPCRFIGFDTQLKVTINGSRGIILPRRMGQLFPLRHLAASKFTSEEMQFKCTHNRTPSSPRPAL
nr:uncharacterized protein LOC115262322 [Aedes albopictus]